MAKSGKTTPMMAQYWEYRHQLPDDTLLLFRLGDFYEMFHDDAENGARILGITLTRRQDYPMAGIPYHAAQSYIPKLLAAGLKVAICDQVETPKPGQLVKRALTRILTPGTTLEDHQLEADQNHFLLAVHTDKQGIHAAWLDVSTGEFTVATDLNADNLAPVLHAISARELLLQESVQGDPATQGSAQHKATRHPLLRTLSEGRPCSYLPDFSFDRQDGARTVMETLGVLNLDGFGLPRTHPALGAAGALVRYVADQLCDKPGNIRRIREYRSTTTLLLDPATLRNLEIIRTTGNQRQGTLLAAMDGTITAAGARLLERWLCAPLLDLEVLQRRQNAVGELYDHPTPTAELQDALRQVRDIPRILARLQNRLRNPRELGGIRDTLIQLPTIQCCLRALQRPACEALAARIADFPKLQSLMDQALQDELPANLQDGGIFRDGFDATLDRLRGLSRDNKTWLSDLERDEQEKTGIKNLRIRYNGAFGYFIEVTKSNLNLVPAHYIRKQTMTNAERYTTEDLKIKEKEILNAEENSLAREQELFNDLLNRVLEEAEALRETAEALAEIDVYAGWSTLARRWDYCRPELVQSDQLIIEQGRHPVVEQQLALERDGLAGSHRFVPNDTDLAASGTQIALITGPNMAGKSTYIRQVGLLVLMAQVGSWVPASRFVLGLVDRVFSRVGASDELAKGNSTFMVEMNETANILNNATARSLVILDEIGRGTSTYDGLSIAWAVAEHLHGTGQAGPRTLFATHYHELTRLEEELPRLRNFTVAVKEWNDDIIFVRRVIPGAADRSYGIQVARLAGLPDAVIQRAKILLDQLETNQGHPVIDKPAAPAAKTAPKPEPARPRNKPDDDHQLALF